MTTCKCSVVHVQLRTFCVILLRIGEKKEREREKKKRQKKGNMMTKINNETLSLFLSGLHGQKQGCVVEKENNNNEKKKG